MTHACVKLPSRVGFSMGHGVPACPQRYVGGRLPSKVTNQKQSGAKTCRSGASRRTLVYNRSADTRRQAVTACCTQRATRARDECFVTVGVAANGRESASSVCLGVTAMCREQVACKRGVTSPTDEQPPLSLVHV